MCVNRQLSFVDVANEVLDEQLGLLDLTSTISCKVGFCSLSYNFFMSL
jgi:hypothetical protein